MTYSNLKSFFWIPAFAGMSGVLFFTETNSPLHP